MDKTAIKNYAISARRKLIEAVKLKAQHLYIFESGDEYARLNIDKNSIADRLRADGFFLEPEQLKARERLYNELLHDGMPYKPEIYNRVIENVAYTWFNRLIALRFMEVNDYLPSGIRILSSLEQGRIEPDALREVERLEYVDQRKVAELAVDKDINASEKLYKYILISQCNELSAILPGMFQEINDYTELLLPDALYAKGGIVHDLVTAISEDDFNIQNQGQIEIIGWLYQFYISEKKDEVFAALKKNVKINKDTIPAATQLFTPEWIVKYMVENSLGRLWLESNPDEKLRKGWKYYVDEAEQEPEVAERLRVLRSENPIKRPEDIRLIDPCMGSGHILVYVFDVLFQIYERVGYFEREIPNLILQHNIFGLDIDDRAGQLAYFALMMKARSYSRRFLRQDCVPQPKVYSVPETKLYVFGLEKWLGIGMSDADRKACFADLKYLAELFGKGKEYGSAIKIDREIDFARLREYILEVDAGQISIDESGLLEQAEAFNVVIDVAEVLAQKFDVVVTNPPYMGASGMSANCTELVKKEYPDSKGDFFAVFIERCHDFLQIGGFQSMITMESWMFLASYEKLRKKLITTQTITNMVHMPYLGKGGTSLGINFGTAAFILRKGKIANYLAQYIYVRYNETNEDGVPKCFPVINERYKQATTENFYSIPGKPIAYWVGANFLKAYESQKISDIAFPCIGMRTGENARFLRYWFEIQHDALGLNFVSAIEAKDSQKKWFPYNKGGDFRKWYGNNEIVVNWENDGKEIKKETRLKYPDLGENLGWKISNEKYYFQPSLTWTFISSASFGIRFSDVGFLFDVGGSSVFSDSTNTLYYLLGFLTSKIAFEMLKISNPTLNFQVVNIASLPLIKSEYLLMKC